MTQEQKRRGVGPVRIFQHQQRRAALGDAGQQVGDGGVQPVALGVRIGLQSGRAIAQPGAQIGEQPRELAAAGADGGAQLLGLGGTRQLVERVDERSVRVPHLGVAGAVEHKYAVPRRLAGELPHEPALPRAGLAAEQDYPSALPLGARQECPEPLQLGRAPNERKRRGEAERAWKIVRHEGFRFHHSQI